MNFCPRTARRPAEQPSETPISNFCGRQRRASTPRQVAHRNRTQGLFDRAPHQAVPLNSRTRLWHGSTAAAPGSACPSRTYHLQGPSLGDGLTEHYPSARCMAPSNIRSGRQQPVPVNSEPVRPAIVTLKVWLGAPVVK